MSKQDRRNLIHGAVCFMANQEDRIRRTNASKTPAHFSGPRRGNHGETVALL